MKLQTIFDQLSSGPLSQATIGGQPMGQITPGNYKQIVDHVNLGLTALYKRFNLKEGRLTLSLQPGQFIYPLVSKYAVSNRRSQEPLRTIMDDAHNPFLDDILKIEQVLTEAKAALPINQAGEAYSCFTPNMTTLLVPEEVVSMDARLPAELKTHYLTVLYRAGHPTIVKSLGHFNPATVDVELPPSHLEALLWFVASSVHNPIGMSNEFHAGNSYYAKYEAACLALENQGLQINQGPADTRFRDNGWA